MLKTGLSDEVKYYNGREFAKAVNRALTTPDIEFPPVKAFDRDYAAMSEELDGKGKKA